MTVCLLVVSDGRHEYHHRALASALEQLPKFDQYVFVEDPDHRLGFSGAIAQGWEQVECDHVFHLEADFTFNAPVPVGDMLALLDRRPYLAQVALKRQPVNEQEKRAGGIIECAPQDFREIADDLAVWTEHRRFFTTNPSLYSRAIVERGWPQVPQSEGIFTHQLLEDPELRFAFWGAKYDAPTVHHVGDTRAGRGY